MNKNEVPARVRNLTESRVQVIRHKFLDVLSSAYMVHPVSSSAEAADPFCDPVRATFHSCGPKLIEWVLDGRNVEEVTESLMSIIRIRSVQVSTPSETISFILSLRWIFREVLYTSLEEHERESSFLLFESRIDQLLLMALDCYVQCHDKIGQIRITEVKAERERLLKLLRFTGRGERT